MFASRKSSLISRAKTFANFELDYALAETLAKNLKKTRKSRKFLPAKVSDPEVFAFCGGAKSQAKRAKFGPGSYPRKILGTGTTPFGTSEGLFPEKKEDLFKSTNIPTHSNFRNTSKHTPLDNVNATYSNHHPSKTLKQRAKKLQRVFRGGSRCKSDGCQGYVAAKPP